MLRRSKPTSTRHLMSVSMKRAGWIKKEPDPIEVVAADLS